ncbi:hypothetical protein BDQ12DRAFT_731526 [Crucibulum laeve]|uniref:Uncharacterized protein n=1 Tax=Crucibulum laeve TaxID=68775 RepID=A0A5C3MDP2_9AGAR|nr:hypothetical protein BDQ12DRAFT_731526 [Crucibulum laeve]
MEPTATDYGTFVIDILARSSKTIDQKDLRQCIGLASSFLVTDTTTNVVSGIVSWSAGFSRLMDVVVALHAINELELETVNAASKACSECWTAAGAWRGLEDSRSKVREVAGKLKKLLDTNGRTYKGEPVYAP